jgi:hypothetical protein
MLRITKVWLVICIGLICSGGATLAYGDWSQEFTQNYPPEEYGPFTKMEFFIMPGAPAGVSFAAPTSISPAPGSSSDWVSTIPNSQYSLLTGTGSGANTASVTVFFSGARSDTFDLDFLLWNGNTVVERQEFQWLGSYWASNSGTLILNSLGGFDPGDYDRSEGTPTPIPSTILFFGPTGLGFLLLKKRFAVA